MTSISRRHSTAAARRTAAAALTILTALAFGRPVWAERTVTTFVFDMRSSRVYDVTRNGSALTSASTSPNGVAHFTYAGSAGDVISLEITLASVTISAFEARAASTGGPAVLLEWEIQSDEAIGGYVVYRAKREDPSRGLPVHGERALPPQARSLVDRSAAPATWYRYTLVVLGGDGGEAARMSRTVRIEPARLELDQNVPNPFNPQTTVSFVLPSSARVRLDIYDVEGRLVATLVDSRLPPGRHRARWGGVDRDGTPVATGTYFYRLRAGKQTLSRKMLLVK